MFLGLISSSAPVSALSGADFNAGRIIDDVTFFSPNTMSPDDIQLFLNAKVPTCDTNGTQPSGHPGYPTRADWGTYNGAPPPYTCLKDYSQSIPGSSPDSYCSDSIGAGTRSAAQIIYDVSRACGINPKVLIVLLQKEQGLVTDDWPWPSQYRSATGYGCPDTASCDAQYYGFFNQVYNAARVFQYYAKINGPNYVAGRANFIAYQANRPDCGGTNVFLQNQATAGLYNYTPYQPNQAALNNLYGTGDGCSAYGNRNFWRFFNDWFGSTYSNDTFVPHPTGTLVSSGGRVYLIGTDGKKHWITNSDVFNSYGYPWFQVKVGSIGDSDLSAGANIDTLAPGTIFYTDNSPIYVMTYESGNLVKQQISYTAFNDLGYSWSEVVYVPPTNVPAATASSILFANQHPAGTLVAGNGKAYLLDQTSKRWILNPDSFNTNNFDWNKVKAATEQDLALPDGTPVDLRQGNILFSNGNIYLVDYDSTSILKRPLGPWECFADHWHYAYRDLYQTVALPDRTGPIATC
ncbi:hypothetical protein HYS42_02065 [Candidatus Saccharibacteria bacterium]|nr:hypothetical protein [Candidatus Saccharibacteria bacterium]